MKQASHKTCQLRHLELSSSKASQNRLTRLSGKDSLSRGSRSDKSPAILPRLEEWKGIRCSRAGPKQFHSLRSSKSYRVNVRRSCSQGQLPLFLPHLQRSASVTGIDVANIASG